VPRPKRVTAPARVQPNSIIASAATLSQRTGIKPKNVAQEWQPLAWYYYDTIGELRYGVNWVANALSRVTLHIKQDLPDGAEEQLEEGAPVDALEALYGGEAGQSQMMATLGTHLSVPGECYLIGEPGLEDEDGQATTNDTWLVASTEEVSEQAGVWKIDRGDGRRPLAEEALIIRIWRHHPRQWVLADSSVRAVLPVLREIEALTKHVGASVDSRLAGAGIFLVPSEMTFSAPPTTALGPVPDVEDPTEVLDPNSDPFLVALTEAMLMPIEDRGNAAAVVPIVIRAPGALLGDAKHITFSTPLDAHAQELRTEAIRRLALGLDLPPEVVLGQSDSNHWSAWQIEEAALKVHIEPLCELICAALTEQYLRPALKADPTYAGDVDRLHVVASTEDLRLRPDHSTQAIELYDRIELSGEALRRETGFDPEDAPDESDIKNVLLRKMAMGVTTGDMTAAAMAALGVSLQPQASEVVPTTSPGTEPATPAEPEPTERAIPQAAALLACGEVLVLRALERANNRLNRRGQRRRPITAEACDLALLDAWDHAPRVAAVLDVEEGWFVSELDRYTRALLTEGADHTPRLLARCLTARSSHA